MTPPFPAPPPSISRYLHAGAANRFVSIYDIDPFVYLTTVNIHKKAIIDLAVHHSGRLALTVGKDSSFAMVNLIRGRRSFSCKFEKEAGIVGYSELGRSSSW